MIPSEFKLMRQDMKLTQLQLALLMGVSKETIGNIERSHTVSLVHELAIKQLNWQTQIRPALENLL